MFDAWARGALMVHEMHRGTVWTRKRLMARFDLSRAQAGREMHRLAGLPDTFVTWRPNPNPGSSPEMQVSITAHITKGTAIAPGLDKVLRKVAAL